MTDPTDPIARAAAMLNRGDAAGARALAEDALAGGSDSAALRNVIGVACCQGGDLQTGVIHLQRAVELAPNAPGILIMLMRALIDIGRPRDALRLPFRGEELPRPALLLLWRTRAEAAHRAGDDRLEIEALDKILLLDPSDVRAAEMAVPLLVLVDRHAEALDRLNAMPSTRGRQRIRATALAGLRRLDEAIAVDSALLGSDPQDREAWLSLLLLADRVGDAALLSAMIAAAEQQRFTEAEVNFARALLAKRDGRTGAALALAEASEVPADPARRFGLIASLASRLGRAEQAFDAATYRAAATPGCETWRGRGAQHRAGLERVLAVMTSKWRSRWSPQPPPDRPSPNFLVGFPRSGTTLLDTFLMGHPGVAVLEEQPMLDAAARILGDPADLDRIDPSLVAQARDAYFAELDRHLPRGTDAATLVIDKLPLAMTGAAIIHRLFPDAKIIFAQRHPADAVLSCFLQSFQLNEAMANFLNITDAARFYDIAMRIWVRARDVLTLATFDLVYEELVADPARTLRPLATWLGLEWDDALLDHQATAVARGAIVTPSYDQVTQPIHRRSVGRWQTYGVQLAPVRPLLDRWARQLGYGPMQ